MSVTYRKLMVAVDASDEAGRALRHAAALADQLGASLLLVHVHEAPELGAPPPEQPQRRKIWSDERRAAVAEGEAFIESQLAEVAPDYSGDYATLVCFGEPAERLAEVADERNADLLVMGSRGLTGIQRVLLGSVSYKVVRASPLPILVVR